MKFRYLIDISQLYKLNIFDGVYWSKLEMNVKHIVIVGKTLCLLMCLWGVISSFINLVDIVLRSATCLYFSAFVVPAVGMVWLQREVVALCVPWNDTVNTYWCNWIIMVCWRWNKQGWISALLRDNTIYHGIHHSIKPIHSNTFFYWCWHLQLTIWLIFEYYKIHLSKHITNVSWKNPNAPAN